MFPKAEAILDVETKAYQNSLQQAASLWEALLRNEGLLRIARTPLILSLVTLVHKNRTTDLPKGRARLYRECLVILLDLWDAKDKGLTIPDSPSLNDKLLVLKTIAFNFVENGFLEMDKEGLEELVTPLLSSLTKQVSATSLIRQIYERSGVLVEQSIGKYGFAHRALHDYLAASHIAEQNFDALLVKHADEERWREVILIAIGLVTPMQRAQKLLESLLQKSGENAASLALAGWSLAEDIQVGEDLRSSVKKKILEHLEQTEIAGDFALLSSALMDTDSAALSNWMQSVLVGNSAELRIRVLNALLPEIGPERGPVFTPTLVKMLADLHAEPGLRMHAAMVLAKITQDPDGELWDALSNARLDADHWLKSTATWTWCELGRYEELGLVKVPAGEFLMGSTATDDFARDNEKPQHTIYLPTFYIGKYPVTVKNYRDFAQAENYKMRGGSNLHVTDNHPVVNVTWDDAMAFVQAKGMTLPSEAEWEKAARGTDGRIYSWGDEWRDDFANTDEFWSKGARGFWSKIRRKEAGTTTPVGQFSPQGDSPYECADMIGNVWEWTSTLYNEYPYQPDDGRENIGSSGIRILRGGSFDLNRGLARCAYRYRAYPDAFDGGLGFRVVVSPIIKSEP